MADFSDLVGKSGQDLRDAGTFTLRAAEATVGVLANITSIIGIPGAILSLISAFQKDQTAERLQEIAQKLEAVLQFAHAEDAVRQMQQIVVALEAARSRLQTLLELGVNDPLASTPEAFFDALKSANTLADRAFWLRPFFDELVFVNHWFGKVNPPVEDLGGGRSVVFDYRLTLPAFVEAITIRLSVLALLRTDFPAAFQRELVGFADTLEKFRKEIVDGFVMDRGVRNSAGPVTSLSPGKRAPA